MRGTYWLSLELGSGFGKQCIKTSNFTKMWNKIKHNSNMNMDKKQSINKYELLFLHLLFSSSLHTHLRSPQVWRKCWFVTNGLDVLRCIFFFVFFPLFFVFFFFIFALVFFWFYCVIFFIHSFILSFSFISSLFIFLQSTIRSYALRTNEN